MAITPAEAMAGMELTKKMMAGIELTDEEMKKVRAGIRSAMKRADEEALDGEAAVASPVPHECLCPITRQIMLDPVVAADGHSYERTAIQKWFDTGNTKSPMTSEVLLA